jgi:hypothetical protein
MTHDHIGVMLDALLGIPLPDGFTSVYRERHDAVIDHTFRDVIISPDWVDVPTFDFGAPGAYAHLTVDESGDTYTRRRLLHARRLQRAKRGPRRRVHRRARRRLVRARRDPRPAAAPGTRLVTPCPLCR